MDHQRVNISHSNTSCGVMELDRMDKSDMDGVLYAIAGRLYHPSRGEPCAFFIWSDVEKEGDKLADLVNSNEFGAATRTGAYENPKTGNFIRIWTWAIDHEKFKTWYSKKRVEKMRKVGT